MPFYIVTLQLPNGKKTKTRGVIARNEYDAMYRAEQIGANRFYQAVAALETPTTKAKS